MNMDNIEGWKGNKYSKRKNVIAKEIPGIKISTSLEKKKMFV